MAETGSTLLGTDFQGRDTLSRLIFGARISLLVAIMGTAVAGGIGLLLGILAGDAGGWVDQAIMRLTDAWLALPFLMFAIFLAALLGPGVQNIIIVFGFIYWTRYARVIRGEVLNAARARLRAPRPGGRGQPHPDRVATHCAEHHEYLDGARQPDRGRGDRDRGLAQLPRAGGSPADARLGRHAGRDAQQPDGRSVVVNGVPRAPISIVVLAPISLATGCGSSWTHNSAICERVLSCQFSVVSQLAAPSLTTDMPNHHCEERS